MPDRIEHVQAAVLASGGFVAFLVSLLGLEAGIFLWGAVTMAVVHQLSGMGRAFLDPLEEVSATKAVRGFVKKLMLGIVIPVAAWTDAMLEGMGLDAASFGWIPPEFAVMWDKPLTAAALTVLGAAWALDSVRNIMRAGAMPKLVAAVIEARLGAPLNLSSVTPRKAQAIQDFIAELERIKAEEGETDALIEAHNRATGDELGVKRKTKGGG